MFRIHSGLLNASYIFTQVHRSGYTPACKTVCKANDVCMHVFFIAFHSFAAQKVLNK